MSAKDAVNRQRRRLISAAALAPFVGLSACGGGDSATPTTRTWQMGFYPPGIDRFNTRAELVHVHEELPWGELLAGTPPDVILDREKVPLATFARSRGLRVGFMADLTDGASRGEEAPQLRQLGRSITEPAVQQAYRNYVSAFVRKVQPDYVGLAAETNLTRIAGPTPLYAAVVLAANAAAADLRAQKVRVPLMFSVRVESDEGITADLAAFPFAQRLGLSSYPYRAYEDPDDVPDDYYSRLFAKREMPVMVTESSWPGAAQYRYIARHARLLDSVNALAVVQTLFSDVDDAGLAAWDAAFARIRINP